MGPMSRDAPDASRHENTIMKTQILLAATLLALTGTASAAGSFTL